MIECGFPWPTLLAGIDYDLAGIDAVFVTHEHGDHSRAASDLLRAGIDVFMTKGTADALHLSPDNELHNLFLIKTGKTVRQIPGWEVTPFDVEHDAAEPVGFQIEDTASGERTVFITDTAYCRYRFEGMASLMIECNYSEELLEQNEAIFEVGRYNRLRQTHLSLERVLEFIKAQDTRLLKEVYLLHLSDDNSDEAAFKVAVQAVAGCPIYICGAKGGFEE